MTFATDGANTGTDVTHTAGTGTFELQDTGFYEIHYNTVGTNAATATPPTAVGVHLANGGTAIPGTTASATITAANDTAALAGSTIVNVTSAPATITLVADNGDGSFSNTSMVIRKLD